MPPPPPIPGDTPHTLSTHTHHPRNTPCQHTLSTYPHNTPVNTHLSIHPVNTPCQYTLSIHPVNTPCQHTLSTHLANPTYQHLSCEPPIRPNVINLSPLPPPPLSLFSDEGLPAQYFHGDEQQTAMVLHPHLPMPLCPPPTISLMLTHSTPHNSSYFIYPISLLTPSLPPTIYPYTFTPCVQSLSLPPPPPPPPPPLLPRIFTPPPCSSSSSSSSSSFQAAAVDGTKNSEQQRRDLLMLRYEGVAGWIIANALSDAWSLAAGTWGWLPPEW